MDKIPQEDWICETCKTNYKHRTREMTRGELNDWLSAYRVAGWKYKSITPTSHLMALLALECSWKERDELRHKLDDHHMEIDILKAMHNKKVEELRVENENLKRNLSKPRNLIYDQYFGLCKSNSELMTRVNELEGELKETVIQLTEEISKTVPPATLD